MTDIPNTSQKCKIYMQDGLIYAVFGNVYNSAYRNVFYVYIAVQLESSSL